ncbi:50S ribosomal protein L24 [Candidatus Bathyarchaeota archaeon]|nr:MAG: 50S ribosomal protein L24 [Candidatus Bathyarchaeota archaeon]RLI32996.1 MAG: 50S ribosomal protein L24 [Candidatus Bathyarchaeota archaeon]
MAGGGVKDPGKNRLRLFTAPVHRRRKRLSVLLSPSLRAEHGVKSLPVRSGDTVVVRRGEWMLQEGKVLRVDTERGLVFVDNIKQERADGREVHIPLRPENLMITKLDMDDEWRKRIIERRGYRAKV